MALLLSLIRLNPLNCILFGKKGKNNSFAEKSATGHANGWAALLAQPGKKTFYPMPVLSGGCSPALAEVLGLHPSSQGEAV
jgi:hypothetical protein